MKTSIFNVIRNKTLQNKTFLGHNSNYYSEIYQKYLTSVVKVFYSTAKVSAIAGGVSGAVYGYQQKQPDDQTINFYVVNKVNNTMVGSLCGALVGYTSTLLFPLIFFIYEDTK